MNTQTVPSVSRYHPVLVTLHWALALLITVALAGGALRMAPLANTNPAKWAALRVHMTGGILILILMSLRLLIRSLTLHPPPAKTGTSLLDRVARFSHTGFYAFVIAMTISGITLAVQAGVIGLTVGGHPPIPPDFWAFPLRTVHYLISRVLMSLIVLHLAGVLYHTFVRRDQLLRRMGFGRRLYERVAPWLTRLVLALAAFLFAMIARRFIGDPVSAAGQSGMVLTTPIALTTVRASFGAFPLACSAVALTCLVSAARNRIGLWFVAMVLGIVLAVRVYGIVEDGTLRENQRILAAEVVLLSITLLALRLGRAGRRDAPA